MESDHARLFAAAAKRAGISNRIYSGHGFSMRNCTSWIRLQCTDIGGYVFHEKDDIDLTAMVDADLEKEFESAAKRENGWHYFVVGQGRHHV